jgi:hypothetical protein
MSFWSDGGGLGWWERLALCFEPGGAEVFPRRVGLLDQGDLLCAKPAFEFLFSLDCAFRAHETLKPNKAVTVVRSREALVDFLLMLEDADPQIARHSYIKRAAATGDDVSAITARVHGKSVRRSVE